MNKSDTPEDRIRTTKHADHAHSSRGLQTSTSQDAPASAQASERLYGIASHSHSRTAVNRPSPLLSELATSLHPHQLGCVRKQAVPKPHSGAMKRSDLCYCLYPIGQRKLLLTRQSAIPRSACQAAKHRCTVLATTPDAISPLPPNN